MDALLTNYHFIKYPDATPKILTNCRNAIVGRESFCRMTYSLGLHKELRRSGGHNSIIDPYIQYLDSLPPFSDPMATDLQGPKILCDVFEAVVGAIFIDSQGNWTQTLNAIWPVWSQYLDIMAPENLTPA